MELSPLIRTETDMIPYSYAVNNENTISMLTLCGYVIL